MDAQASRRVVFKFRLTDDRMIEQMRSILEESADEAQAEPTPAAEEAPLPEEAPPAEESPAPETGE